MRKTRKLASFILALTIIISSISLSFAQGLNDSDIMTGFYVKDGQGNNIFIDIYTYLNNKETYLPIINNGLENVLFIHQNGKGARLQEILDGNKFRELELNDFEETYKNAGNEDEILNPRDSFYSLTAELDKDEYYLDDTITLSGKVLKVKDGYRDVDITLKVDGIELILVDQIITDENGNFETTFTLPEDTELGSYKLTVKANEPVNKFITLDLVIVEKVVDDPIPEAIIGEIADKILEIRENIAEEDKEAIRTAKSNIVLVESWDTILADILTPQLIAKFEDEVTAKNALKLAIIDLAEIQYSVDAINLKSSLMTYSETHLPTFRAIFGYDESAEVLFRLFKEIIVNIPNAITPTQGNAVVEATDVELIGLIEEIAKATVEYTLNQPAYNSFIGRLSEVGLSIDTLIAVRSKLAAEIDTNNVAQIALINAYARSQSVLTGAIELKVGETAKYSLTVFGREVSTLANWSTSNPEVATIVDDTEVILTGVSEGTITITAYRGTDEANWIVKLEVKVLPAVAGEVQEPIEELIDIPIERPIEEEVDF